MTTREGQSPQPHLDQLKLVGLRARGFHGVLAAERTLGQEFIVDVTVYLNTRTAALGDSLDETVNYAQLAVDVLAIVTGPPVRLIETLAERIAELVLHSAAAQSVSVTVHKPQAPISVPFADVAIGIFRSRE